MHDIAFQVFSGASLILIIMPIAWHIRALNIGTLSLIAWVFLGNLFFFINAIIWYNKIWDPAPIWCDITAKFQIGMSVGIPAACLCTNRRLYRISTMQLSQLDRPSLRRLVYQELGWTVGLPALVMVLHYVVQGRRYDLVQGVGCWAHTYWSWPAIWLVLQWPFAIGLVSLAYGVAAFMVFRKSHVEWNETLRSKQLGLTKSRYIRLMALSCGEMAFILPLGFWIFYLSVGTAGINPWISWDYVHLHWYDIEFYDDLALEAVPLQWTVTALTRWCLPVTAVAFFAFFGLSGGAIEEYGKAFRFVLAKLHIHVPRRKVNEELELGETFSQFEQRFHVDYERQDRKEEQDGEQDATALGYVQAESIKSSLRITDDLPLDSISEAYEDEPTDATNQRPRSSVEVRRADEAAAQPDLGCCQCHHDHQRPQANA